MTPEIIKVVRTTPEKVVSSLVICKTCCLEIPCYDESGRLSKQVCGPTWCTMCRQPMYGRLISEAARTYTAWKLILPHRQQEFETYEAAEGYFRFHAEKATEKPPPPPMIKKTSTLWWSVLVDGRPKRRAKSWDKAVYKAIWLAKWRYEDWVEARRLIGIAA